MRQILTGIMTAVLILVTFMFGLMPGMKQAGAQETRIDYLGLDLVGDLVVAKGKSLKKHGVILLLHDVMSYKQDRGMADLRASLIAKNLNVLAINLSLGLEGRTGRYDCAIEQDHLYTDALPEIHAWVKWLQQRKTTDITLLGMGLGANQIALYGSKTTQKSVRRIALLSPSVSSKEQREQNYQQLHGKGLPDLLFEAEAKIGAELAGSLLDSPGFLHCPKARVTARSFVSYYSPKPQFDVISLISSIKRPLLVIAAELGEASENLVQKMQNIEARSSLKLDVVEGADMQFTGVSMSQVADRIKLFGDETRGK